MQVTYKKYTLPKKTNCFEIKFDFSHGDADANTSNVVLFKDMSETQLISYIKKFNEIKYMIEETRGSGEDLPDDFEELAVSDGFKIPIERDIYAKLSMSNYFAEISFEEITYYDQDGNMAEVIIK